MKIVKKICQAEIIPAFYGIAWVDLVSNRAVCLPMPFNLIAAFGRSVWIFLKHGWRPVLCSPRDAYDQGFRHGRRFKTEL